MNCYRSRRNLFRKATNLRDHFARYAARTLTRFQFRSMVTMLLVLTCVQTGVAQVELWTRQFGTRGSDIAHSAAVDRAGNIYITGSTTGAFTGQNLFGGAFLRKYDSGGNELWTRQFGLSYAAASSVAVDSSGNVYLAGDAFLRKYDSGGNELWTRQFGTSSFDAAYSVAADNNGNIFVAGRSGNDDAFLCKYDADGNQNWLQRFGGLLVDIAYSVSVDGAGNAYVAGLMGQLLPTESGPQKDYDAFLRKYDSAGSVVWSRQIGGSPWTASWSIERAYSVVVDNAGNVYVAGEINGGVLPGQTNSGGWLDAFLRKYDPTGNELWTRQFGTARDDTAYSVTIDSADHVYVAGESTGLFPDSAPSCCAFLRKYDASGNDLWTRQFGTWNYEAAYSVVTGNSDSVYVVGATPGSFPGQLSSGDYDAFVRKYDPRNPTRISIGSIYPEPSTFRQRYSIPFVVTPLPDDGRTPTGTVTVSDGTESCSATVTAATCNLTSSSAGPKTITATYSGDATFAASSASTFHAVIPASTSLAIGIISPELSRVGESYTVHYSVTSTVGTPDGNVVVSDGWGGACAAAVADGACTLTSTVPGSLVITAVYSGSSNFNGSDGTASHYVLPAGYFAPTTIVGTAPDPSFVNEPYAVTVTVSFYYGTPTGTVTVVEGKNSCVITLVAGVGSCFLTSTTLGVTSIGITYSGDSYFLSSSNTLDHTVTPRPPSNVTAIKTATTKEKTTTYSANITWTGNVHGKTSYTDSKATADTCAYAVAATKASVASAFVLSNRLE